MVGDLAVIVDSQAIGRPYRGACSPPQIKDVSVRAPLKLYKIKLGKYVYRFVFEILNIINTMLIMTLTFLLKLPAEQLK